MVAVDPVVVELGGQKFIWDASTMIVKTLTKQILLTTGLSFEDETGVDYQVPTGKKFIALEIKGTPQIDTGKGVTLYSSTAADGTTGESDKFIFVYPAALDAFVGTFNVNLIFAADLFITAKVASASGTEPVWVIVGIEMDA